MIILSYLRSKLFIKMYYREDRLVGFNWKEQWKKDYDRMNAMMHGYPAGQIKCCDCGLAHLYWVEKDIMFAMPIRPKGYGYVMRLWARKGSYATEVMKDNMKALK